MISIGENRARDVSVYFVFKSQITQTPVVTVTKIRVKNVHIVILIIPTNVLI
jgi:hypothetical protein